MISSRLIAPIDDFLPQNHGEGGSSPPAPTTPTEGPMCESRGVFDLSDLFPITDWFNEIHKIVAQKGR